MIRRPPVSTRTDTLLPDPTLCRSRVEPGALHAPGSVIPARVSAPRALPLAHIVLIVDAHARLSSDCPRGRVAAALSESHDRLLQHHPSRRPSPLSRRLRPSSAERPMLSSTSPPARVDRQSAVSGTVWQYGSHPERAETEKK